MEIDGPLKIGIVESATRLGHELRIDFKQAFRPKAPVRDVAICTGEGADLRSS